MTLGDEMNSLSDAVRRLRKELDDTAAVTRTGARGAAAGGAAGGNPESFRSNDYVQLFRMGNELVQTTNALIQAINGVPDMLKVIPDTVAAGLREFETKTLGRLQVHAQASQAVVGQVASFQLAGIDVPQETIRRMVDVEIARAERVRDLESQVRAETTARQGVNSVRYVGDKAQQLLNLNGGGM